MCHRIKSGKEALAHSEIVGQKILHQEFRKDFEYACDRHEVHIVYD